MKYNKYIMSALVAGMCVVSASAAVEGVAMSPRAAVLCSRQAQSPLQSVNVYLTVDAATLNREALENLGVKISTDAGNIMTARVPMASLSKLAEVEGVIYVETSSAVQQMLDKASLETGIADVRQGSTLSQPYTGRGVVVGIVDSGFDYTHAAFRDSEGRLRISRVWEQTSQSSEGDVTPQPFGYGIEFTDPDRILAAAGDVRNKSHGTHVTGIAAGSDTFLDGALTGMAPDAEIVLVSMLDAGHDNVTISDAIAYIFAYAESVGKPCVINLSLGSHAGPHDGSSTFDVMADGLVGKGRLIVGSAGNHRADKFHVSRTFSGDGEETLASFIDFKYGLSASNVGGELEVWGSKDMDMKVELIAYKTSSGEVAESVTVYPYEGEDAAVSLGRNVTGTFSVASGISPLNGKPNVYLKSGITGIRTGYAVGVRVTSSEAGQADIWADNVYLGLTSKNIEGFEEPGNASTICEIGGTANRILTVGAYTSRTDYTLFNESNQRHTTETLGAVCSFSSAGPTADGRIKPQVSAPGSLISSAVSSHDASGTLLISQVHTTDDGHDHLYGFMQGTSMSSPMVTGIVATWLQAYPDLSPEELQQVIRTTSRRDDMTGDLAEGDSNWGYGKIDALAGIRECIRLRDNTAIQGATADNAPSDIVAVEGGLLTVTFAASRTHADIAVWSAAGGRLLQQSINRPQAGSTASFDISSLPKGVYIFSIETPQGSKSFKFIR